MNTGFCPRVSGVRLLRFCLFLLRVTSLGAAVAYAVVER